MYIYSENSNCKDTFIQSVEKKIAGTSQPIEKTAAKKGVNLRSTHRKWRAEEDLIKAKSLSLAPWEVSLVKKARETLESMPKEAPIPDGFLLSCINCSLSVEMKETIEILKSRGYTFQSEYTWFIRGFQSKEWFDLVYENIPDINIKTVLAFCTVTLSDCDTYSVHPIVILHIRTLMGDDSARAIADKIRSHPKFYMEDHEFMSWTKKDIKVLEDSGWGVCL